MGNVIIDALGLGWVQASLAITLSLSAAILSVVLYYRSKRYSRLTCAVVHTAVLGVRKEGFNDDLEVLFKGEKVSSVMATLVAVWNSGKDTINGEQVVKTDKIKVICVEGTEILQADVIGVSRDVICATVNRGKNRDCAEIEFDYLDRLDGILLQIVHTGHRGSVDVNGTIRGIPEGISSYRYPKRFGQIYVYSIAGFVAGLAINVLDKYGMNSEIGQIRRLLSAIIALVLVSIITLSIIIYVNYQRKVRIPKVISQDPHMAATLLRRY